MTKEKNPKGRYWAFILYPESLPNDWQELIFNMGVPMAFSPLHDKDVNPDGTPKKPHYHVICYYDNNTTYKSVKESITDKLNGSFPMKLQTMRAMYRYHIHQDNPEKAQYQDHDRQFFNGFDIHRVGDYTYTEKAQMLKEIQRFICNNYIYEYSDLLDILLDNEMYELWDVARNNTLLLNTYITSRRYKTKQEKKLNEKEVDK